MTQSENSPPIFGGHDGFVARYLQKEMQRERTPEEIRRRVGRVPIPESEQRAENSICVYVNPEELEIIREYVGSRNMSEVLRNAILDKAVYFHSLKQRRTKK